MAKQKKQQRRGYISKFLKSADNAIGQGIKKADEALDAGIELGVISAKQAKLEAKKLRKQAEKEALVLQKNAEIEAKKIRQKSEKEIQKRVSKIKRSSSKQENLRLLEKLAKLKKVGIITEKEFQSKKKELLKEI